MNRSGSQWRLSPTLSIELDQPRLMGILNITPDSFSDGGSYASADLAAERALEMESQGATIIDVGGESTRPGADRIDARDQVARVVPVITAIRRHSEIPISIDTTLSAVAEAAVDAGAQAINDVSAGLEDPGILALAARRNCGLILMHRLRPPGEDCFSTQYRQPPSYDDVVGEVGRFLRDRAQAAREAGVAAETIVVDPGLGFGKSVAQNWELIRQSDRLVAEGYPVLGAASRKSFLEVICGPDVPASRRGPASVAASIIQYRGGIRLFRVHDVGLHAAGLARAHREGSPTVPGPVSTLL
ncbi:MAG: dihydropteroate synthase [Phycisphaerales bacterium]|nr:dihydropteroate synthase [Phycisphaerales bacterium]